MKCTFSYSIFATHRMTWRRTEPSSAGSKILFCFKSSIVHDCCRVSRYTLSIHVKGIEGHFLLSKRTWEPGLHFTVSPFVFLERPLGGLVGFWCLVFALFWCFSFCLCCCCCCCCCLGLRQQAHLVTRPLSLPMTLVRICKDCHYRQDERSNSPKKKQTPEGFLSLTFSTPKIIKLLERVANLVNVFAINLKSKESPSFHLLCWLKGLVVSSWQQKKKSFCRVRC